MVTVHNFKKVGELRDKDRNVDIFGVVKFFQGLPRTKKGDHHMVITLIDDSVGEDVEAGVRCNIFEKDLGQLPSVQKVGDILLLKQVRVTSFNGRLQVQRTDNFQWLVFGVTKNSAGNHIVVRKSTSLIAPSFRQYEQLRLKELLTFLSSTENKILESESMHEDGKDIVSLDSLKPGTYVDVIVRVVAICGFQNRSEKALLVKVTDGSRVAYSSLYQMGVVKKREVSDFERATGGYCCDISVFDEHVDAFDSIEAGDFIKITNLHVKGVSQHLMANWKLETGNLGSNKSDEWYELIVHSGTKYNRGISKLSPSDACVAAVKTRIDNLVACYNDAKTTIDRMMGQISRQGKCGLSLTTNCYHSKPVSSIASVIICSNNQCRKFRIQGRLIKLEPKLFKDIIIGKCTNCHHIYRPFGGTDCQSSLRCPACDRETVSITYFLRLLLEDSTALLHVVVMGEDANYFFNGTPPCALLQDSSLMSKYEDILGALEYGEDGSDVSMDAPFMDVCVAKEFSLKNESAMYRMFATKLDV